MSTVIVAITHEVEFPVEPAESVAIAVRDTVLLSDGRSVLISASHTFNDGSAFASAITDAGSALTPVFLTSLKFAFTTVFSPSLVITSDLRPAVESVDEDLSETVPQSDGTSVPFV